MHVNVIWECCHVAVLCVDVTIPSVYNEDPWTFAEAVTAFTFK